MTTLPKETRIGHVHLKVADLERAIGFYRDVLGFDLVTRYGTQAAFLSAGGYHHHIGLIAACRQKCGLGAVTGDQIKPKDITVKPNGTFKVGYFQVNMPDSGFFW